MHDTSYDVQEFENALLSMNRITAKNLIISKISDGNAFVIIREAVVPALVNIGDMWANGEIALSQEYMASKICEEIVESILPSGNHSRKNMLSIGVTTLGDEHMSGRY